MKHTPGPWKIDTRAERLFIDADNFGTVCRFMMDPPNTSIGRETEANARLIAAAPDAYDLLKAAIERVELANNECNNIMAAWLNDARTVINRIEGRE